MSFKNIRLESLGNNHFYLSLAEEEFNRISGTFPKKKKKEEKSYSPILVDLSVNSASKNEQKQPKMKTERRMLSINSEEVGPQLNFSSPSLKYQNNNWLTNMQNFSNSSQSVLPYGNEFSRIARDEPKKSVFSINNNNSWNGNSLEMLRPVQKGNSFGAETQIFASYLRSVLKIITLILSENKYGIELGLLYLKLVERMGPRNFNPRLFGCDNFQTFLMSYAEDRVDIEMSRNPQTGMICLIIYPKNYRFGIRSRMMTGKGNVETSQQLHLQFDQQSDAELNSKFLARETKDNY